MLTHQFPCERYPSNEGFTVTESGVAGGQVIMSGTSLSGRGTKCVLCDATTVGKLAYISRSYTLSPGQYGFVSFYWQIPNAADQDSLTRFVLTGCLALLKQYSTTLRFRLTDALGSYDRYYTFSFAAGGHVAVGVKRATSTDATDGECVLYVNGILVYTVNGLKNYTQAAGSSIRLGTTSSNFSLSDRFDEIRFGTRVEDVLPNAVMPLAASGELPQTARTIVLFNQNSADSKIFAQAIAADESLLCPLPCSTTETLGDYQTFVNEVEHPVKIFFAFQPLIATQTTCIIAGYNVPGFFTDGGQTFSTNGRLADVDNSFEANKENPLYGTSERLTAATLQAAGIRLAARIDANMQAECSTIKSLGDASINVTTDEKYFTTQTQLLNEQLLRLPFETITDGTQVSGDAVVYYAQAVDGWSIGEIANNSRLAFIDSVTGYHTRADISHNLLYRFRAIIFAGEDFNIAAFCRMLLKGGTVAEAFAGAVKKLNSSSQFVGWPFMTASFPKAGYNIYFGDGSQSNIDYSQIHAALPISAEEFEVPIPHKPNSVRAMCIRKISAAGLEETRGRTMMLEADSGGLIHQQLPVPHDLTTRSAGGNAVELSFSCIVREGQSVPSHFEILGDNGSGEINRGIPFGVVQFVRGECEYAAIVEVTNRPAIFTVRARLDNLTGNEASQVTVLPLRVPVKPKVQI